MSTAYELCRKINRNVKRKWDKILCMLHKYTKRECIRFSTHLLFYFIHIGKHGHI